MSRGWLVRMRAIPIDLSAFGGFMCVNPPEPKGNARTGEMKTDLATGLPVYQVGVVAIRGRDSSVIQVAVPGEPNGLMVGTALQLVGLEAVPWEVDGRSGITFRASAIMAVTPDAGPSASAGRRPGAASGASPAPVSARSGDAL